MPLPWSSLLPAEVEYRRKSHVYDYNTCERHGTVFGPLAELFEKEALHRANRGAFNIPAAWNLSLSDLNTVQRIMFNEVMQFCVAWEVLHGASAYGRISVNGNFSRAIRRDLRPYQFPRGNMKVAVVIMGIFQLQEVTLPLDLEMVDRDMPLTANPVIRSTTAQLPDNMMDTSDLSMMFLLRGVYEAPGRVNHHVHDCPTPPPPLQFTEFVLRKHLRLRYADDAFYDKLSTYYSLFRTHFVRNGSIFYEELEDGPGLVEAADTPPAYPYYAPILT